MVEHPRVPGERKIKDVPFVELFNGRLQGVVSSGSDVERVYCAFLEAGSGNYYSSTNNNRPDAGMAKRLRMLVEAAIAQFGEERVVQFLQVRGDPHVPRGSLKAEPAGEVFSRFLNYLKRVEQRTAPGPIPEMDWFVT
jgi:hypothetical protein